MDLEEFEGLIDDYQLAQESGKYKARVDARIALKDAWRAIEAERDALRKDAERYRWLRDEAWGCDKRGRLDVHVCQFGPGVLMSAVTELAEEALDSAIDAAIAAKEPNRE